MEFRKLYLTKMIQFHLLWTILFISAGAILSEEYQWGSVAIGGGGYVTGLVVHPTIPNLLYIRTDVGGAYRYDATDQRWIPLTDWVGPANKNLIGVDGMAIDPGNPDVVYAALGQIISSDGGVYRSNNRGATWSRVLDAKFHSNSSSGRWIGECLLVDPNNSGVVYCGTRTQGFWRSLDSAKTWAQINSVPPGYTGTNPSGIRSIVIDPSATSNNRSQTVYVGIPGSGVYASTDGGDNFLASTGSPANPNRMAVDADGRLLVAHETGVAVLWGETWSTITPTDAAGTNFVGLAVDFSNSNRILIARHQSAFSNALYRSTNGGTSWEKLGAAPPLVERNPDVTWWPDRFFSSATSSVVLDPHYVGKAYLTDWFGTWFCDDVWASPTQWYTKEKGHEETVVLTMTCPTEGPFLISCTADVVGFRHTNLDEYPLDNLTDANEGFSIDFCERHPTYLAMLDATSWDGANTRLVTSSDGGVVWNAHAVPAGKTLGKIAYSSTDSNRVVYCPADNVPYTTSNRGASWQQSTGVPSGAIPGSTDIWGNDFALAADRVNGARFYLFHEGSMYETTDGGISWAIANTVKLPLKDGEWGTLNVVAAPSIEGELWVGMDRNGLWRSSNGGQSFTKMAWFTRVTMFAFGKNHPGTTFPSAYAWGVHDGAWGLYRSNDLGATWERINDNTQQFSGIADYMAADRQTYGRVFIGTGGRGVIYGEPSNQTTVRPANYRTPGLMPVNNKMNGTSAKMSCYRVDGTIVQVSHFSELPPGVYIKYKHTSNGILQAYKIVKPQ